MESPYRDLARPPLRHSTLERALVREGSLWREIRLVDTTVSTNADVERAAQSGTPEGLVVVAEHQTAGRGRLGRDWVSPPRAGLTFSVLLRPVGVPEGRWTWLPLLAGVAIAEGIEHVAEIDVRLKWPNDLLVDGRKLGGILAGRHGEAVVIGVGFNVTTSAAEVPDDRATSLLLCDAATTDRETLLRSSLRAFSTAYLAWRDEGGQATSLAETYAARCDTLGSDVRVALPDGTVVEGRATGLDDDGRLVVSTPRGERALSSGDVVHVRPR